MSRKRGVAPCGPASRQEQGSRRRAEPAAAVGLAVGLYLVWEMAEGPRRRWPGAPAGPESIIYSRGALPVAVAVRRRIVDDGGAEVPSKAETDTVEPVVAAETVSCVELLDRGVGCAMGVAAARASADPLPPSMVRPKPRQKRCQRQARSKRPVQSSVVATEAEP